MLAISPGILGDEEGFLSRAQEMCDRVKHAKVLPDLQAKGFEILLPGERGDQIEAENIANDSIEVDAKHFQQLQDLIQS